MAILKLKRRENLEILFGLKLPLIVSSFYTELKNKKKALDITRQIFKIKENRLINFVDVRDNKGQPAIVLVIYDNFVTEKERNKLNLEIEEFNFNIFEFDYNKEIDIETIIQNIKNKF